MIGKVPFGEPVEWCHRMVITRKHDGSPNRTVDLSPLNKDCKRETFSSESPFQDARLVPKKGTWETVTDAWNGFHGMQLRECDNPLTTFITPYGRWHYIQVPQGYLLWMVKIGVSMKCSLILVTKKGVLMTPVIMTNI